MPRRHPKEDDQKTGPSPQRLQERKERRDERRDRRSPGNGVQRGLLTDRERTELRMLQRDLIRVGDEAGAREVKRELDHDAEAIQKSSRRSRAAA